MHWLSVVLLLGTQGCAAKHPIVARVVSAVPNPPEYVMLWQFVPGTCAGCPEGINFVPYKVDIGDWPLEAQTPEAIADLNAYSEWGKQASIEQWRQYLIDKRAADIAGVPMDTGW